MHSLYPHGVVHVTTNTDNQGRVHGIYEEFYPNGQMKLRAEYDHGIVNGAYEEHYPNGQLKSELHYEQGELHGDVIYYREDGRMLTQATYQNGTQLFGMQAVTVSTEMQITDTFGIPPHLIDP